METTGIIRNGLSQLIIAKKITLYEQDYTCYNQWQSYSYEIHYVSVVE